MPAISISGSRFARLLALGTAIILGVALLSGLAVAAAHAQPAASLTVRLLSPTGKLVPDGEVIAIHLVDGTIDPSGDGFTELAPVAHHSGEYAADDMLPGPYTLILGGSYKSQLGGQFLGGGQDPDTAKVVTLAPGQNAFDASFAKSGKIGGTVRNAKGKAVSHVCVDAYQYDGKDWNDFGGEEGGCVAVTNSKGKYSFDPGSAGSYKIEFFDEGGIYLPQFANGAADLDDATSVYLGSGGSATVNTTLALGGSLSGKLLSPGGLPLDREVDVYALTGTPGGGFTGPAEFYEYRPTDSHGAFAVSGLPTGYYTIGYENEDDGSGAGFIGGSHALTATPFLVTAPHTTSVGTITVDQLPPPVGTLDVTLTGPAGIALPNEDDAITLLSPDGIQFSPDSSVGNVYHFTDLPADDYQLVADIEADFGPEFEPTVVDVPTHAADETASIQVESYSALAFTTEPSLSDLAPQAGVPLSVDPGVVAPTASNSTVSYQWYRTPVGGDAVAIRGAKSAAYTPTTGDVDDILSVRVTQNYELDAAGMVVDEESVDRLVTESVAVVAGAPITNSEQPQLITNGGARVGSPIGVDPNAWSVPGAHFSYKWYRGATQIATGSTYTPAPGDVSQTISVWVTASKTGYADSIAQQSNSVVVVPGALTVTKAPKITVTKSHGARHFSVTPGTWSVPGATVSTVWSLDGTPVGPGRTLTYAGKTSAVTVAVTAQSTGYTDGEWDGIGAKGISPVPVCDIQSQEPELFSVTVHTGLVCSAPTVPFGNAETEIVTGWQRLVHGKWITVSKPEVGNYVTTAADMGASIRVGLAVHGQYYTSPTAYATTHFAGRTDLIGSGAATIVPHQLAVGETATAQVTGLPVPGIRYHYVWQYQHNGGSWIPITGATKSSLTVTAPVATGDLLRVEVKSTAPGFLEGTLDSDPAPIVVKTVTNLTSPAVSPDGVAAGATATANPGTWSVKGANFTYQWNINGSPVSGATNKTFVTDVSEVGDELTVTVVGHKAGYLDSVREGSAPVDILAAAQPPLTPAGVSLTDVKYLGSVTTPNPNSAFGFGTTFHSFTTSYRWMLGGKTIKGATGATYAPKSSDIGKKLSVRMSFTSTLYQPGSQTSPQVKVLGADAADLAADFANDPNVPPAGTTLSVEVFPANAPDVTILWQSSADNSHWNSIAHAKGRSYTLTTAETGDFVRAVVTSRQKLHQDAVTNTQTVSVGFTGELASVSKPTISSAAVGAATTVTLGAWNTTGVTVAYQWLLDGQPIPGATGAKFTPVPGLVTQELSVRVTGTKPGWEGAPTATSASDAIAYGAALTVVAKPVITGSAKTCSTLTVTPGSWRLGGTVVTYQWFAGANPIGGATAATLKLPSAAVGQKIHVELTANLPGYQQGVYDTANTATVTAGASCP